MVKMEKFQRADDTIEQSCLVVFTFTMEKVMNLRETIFSYQLSDDAANKLPITLF